MFCPYFVRSGCTICVCAPRHAGHWRSANSSTRIEELALPVGGFVDSAERPSLLMQPARARIESVKSTFFIPSILSLFLLSFNPYEPLPQVSPQELCGCRWAGTHRDHLGACRGAQSAGARVSLLRSPRNGENLGREDSCENPPHPGCEGRKHPEADHQERR